MCHRLPAPAADCLAFRHAAFGSEAVQEALEALREHLAGRRAG